MPLLLSALNCTAEALAAPKLAALRSHNIRGISARPRSTSNDAERCDGAI
jgi:hypothetical protein